MLPQISTQYSPPCLFSAATDVAVTDVDPQESRSSPADRRVLLRLPPLEPNIVERIISSGRQAGRTV